MSSRSRLLVFLVSTPLVLFVAVGGILGASAAPRQQALQHLGVFRDVLQLVMTSYVEPVDIEKAMDGAMRGLADGLDRSSAYLSPAEVRAIESNTPAPAGEIGVVVTRQFWVRVVGVRDGSPAAQAGLQTGDVLRMIDGKATRDMSALEGARLLRGAPGSKVALLVLRTNAAEPHQVEITRQVLPATRVTGKRLAGGEGYVRVASFASGAAADLRKEVDTLQNAGAVRAVIDLRGTADGVAEEAIAAARHFVKSGTLATRAGRAADSKIVTTAGPGDGALTLPLVLLVSNGTANAAEIFAAALQATKRAELVGEPTAGIAAVQRLVRLPDERGLWMTYARYLGPDGTPIHDQGLKPDIAVDEPSVPFGEPRPAADEILTRAVDRVKMLLIKK